MKYHSNLARFIRGINNEIVETGDYTTTFKGGIDSKTEYIFIFFFSKQDYSSDSKLATVAATFFVSPSLWTSYVSRENLLAKKSETVVNTSGEPPKCPKNQVSELQENFALR